MIAFFYVGLIFVGLVLGSFSTALIYRIPRGIPWAFQDSSDKNLSQMSAYKSSCTQCGENLRVRDLVPVLSWVFSGGRCRYCGEEISKLYVFVELCALVATFLIFFVEGVGGDGVFAITILPFMLALFVIDLRHFILPNILMLIVAGVGMVRVLYFALYAPDYAPSFIVSEYVLGAFVYGACAWGVGRAMTYFLKKPAMGFGDVKFFAVAGLWLGLSAFPFFCFFAGGFGVVFGLGWRMFKKEVMFPFGPALIASFSTLLLWGDEVRALLSL